PGVLANDTAGGLGWVTTSLVSTTSHGFLTFNGDGSFYYMPFTNFVGTDSFVYRVHNDAGGSHATDTITVTDNAPTTLPSFYSAQANHPFIVSAKDGVLTSDSDVDGDSLTAQLVSGMGPTHGTLVLNSDGSYTYTPNAGYVGTDTFVYKASDG